MCLQRQGCKLSNAAPLPSIFAQVMDPGLELILILAIGFIVVGYCYRKIRNFGLCLLAGPSRQGVGNAPTQHVGHGAAEEGGDA